MHVKIVTRLFINSFNKIETRLFINSFHKIVTRLFINSFHKDFSYLVGVVKLLATITAVDAQGPCIQMNTLLHNSIKAG